MKKLLCFAFLMCVAVGTGRAQSLSGPYPVPSGGGGGGVTTNVSGLDYYVAPPPLGNNTNAGTRRDIPFGDLLYASQSVTNFGQTIHMMTGTNYVPLLSSSVTLTNPCQIVLTNGVNLVGDNWNSLILFTNSNVNRYVKIYCVGSNTIDNLSIFDAGTNNSEIIFGSGTGDPTVSKSGIVIKDCYLSGYGMAFHTESPILSGKFLQYWFLNDVMYFNSCCINSESGGIYDMIVQNCTLEVTNFANIYLQTTKPSRCVEASITVNQPTGKFLFNNDEFKYSDADQTTIGANSPVRGGWGGRAYGVWLMPSSAVTNNPPSLKVTNIFYFNGCSFWAKSVTNSASVDVFGGTNAFSLSPSCIRIDNTPLTFTNDYSAVSPINWVTGGGIGLTQTGIDIPTNSLGTHGVTGNYVGGIFVPTGTY